MYSFKNRKGTVRLANSVQKKNSFMSENVIRKNFKIVRGAVGIGSGTYGDVYAGYTNKTMRFIDVVKKFKSGVRDDNEIALTRKLYGVVPRHVVRIRSTTKDTLVMDMYRGGAIGDWLKKTSGINDGIMMVLILQVLVTLYKIHQKYPSFRHNDLHLGNVFIDDRYIQDRGEQLHSYKIPPIGVRAVLGDFGLAGTPSSDVFPGYGIYPGNDEMYDAHLFLNALLTRYAKKREKQLPLTVKFLEDVLKGGYSGETNTHVNRFRLKEGAQFPFDFLMLLNHFYFSVPLRNVMKIPRKTNRANKLKMYKLTESNIRSWGGSYDPIPEQLYSFMLKNLGGGGSGPSPNPRRNSRLSPIVENNKGITHPYRAWSPMYRKRSSAKPQTVKYKRSPLSRPQNLEKNIREFLKNKNFTKVSLKNIRMHLQTKYKGNATLKPRIKEIVNKKILKTPPPQKREIVNKKPLPKLLSPLTPVPIATRVAMYQKDKKKMYPEKVRTYLKSTGEYQNKNINTYLAPFSKKPPVVEKKLELTKFIESQGIKILPPAQGNSTAISPGGRLRIGKKLCTGYKKDELVSFATRAKVSTQGTKEVLCDRLRALKFIPA